jgi:hypothetical protein
MTTRTTIAAVQAGDHRKVAPVSVCNGVVATVLL